MMENTDFDILPCGIYAIDRDNRIRLWNRAMSLLTGVPAEEMLGRPASSIQHYETQYKGRLLELEECLKKDGSPLISRAVYTPDPEGKLRLGFLQARIFKDHPKFRLLALLSDISQEISCEILESSVGSRDRNSFHGIIGRSHQTHELFRLIELASESMANVLVTGESGTGKELIARAIHYNSNRNHRPFVVVNCSALTESLLESELFGHVKGAFTGAIRDKVGKFEAANGGAIFLDEIGDISPLIQLKLLRVIEEKTVERVGENTRRAVDMRIITATNKDLRKLVHQGQFRDDLYYRLKVFPINTEPLRLRKNDIPLLCEHFIEKFNGETGKKIQGLTDNAARLLMTYCWPGNVRELENAIEHAFVLAAGPEIDVFDLPEEVRVHSLRSEVCQEESSRRNNLTKGEMMELLAKNHGNKSATARELGISRVTLWKRLKALGLQE